MENKFYTYILKCAGDVLYTGYTNNLEKRKTSHNNGRGAKFTRGKGPVEIVYYEEFTSKSEAMVREAQIKKLPRIEKLKLIAVMKNDAG